MKRHTTRALTLAMTVAFAAACSGDDSPDNNGSHSETNNGIAASPDAGPPNTSDAGPDDEDIPGEEMFADTCELSDWSRDCLEMSDETIRLGRENHWGIVDASRDGDQLNIEVIESSPLKDALSPGKVIARWRRDRKPLLVKVEAVEWDGNRARVRISRADLKQAFKRGRIRTRFRLDEAASAMQQPMSGELRTVRQPLELGVQNCAGPLDLPPIGNFEAPDVELTRCKFLFTPEVTLIAEWGGLLPDYVEFSAGGQFDAELEAHLNAADEFAFGGEAQIFATGPIPVPAFPILQLSLNLHAGYTAYASGVLDVTGGFTYGGHVTSGFYWAKGQPVRRIFDKENAFQRLGPVVDFDGTAELSVYLKPELELSVIELVAGAVHVEAWGALGVEAELDAVALPDGTTDVSGEVCWELDAGLAPGASVNVFFGLASAELDLEGATWNLSNECAAFETVSTCGADDECVVDADCDGANLTVCQQPVCNSSCTCSYVEKVGCCVTDADCDDGDPTTEDSCGGLRGLQNRCVFSPVNGCTTDAQCDDGLLSTEDKCVAGAAGVKSCENTITDDGLRRDLEDQQDSGLCVVSADCDDNDPATEDTCVARHCQYEIPPDPCDGVDCSDGDFSTIDTCEDGVCMNVETPNRR